MTDDTDTPEELLAIPEDVLAQIVEDTDKDLDWAAERYKEQYDEALDRVKVSSENKGDLAKSVALQTVRKEVQTSWGGFGDAEELPVLTLGYSRFRESEYFVTDGDGIVALGIINPAEDPAGIATFIFDTDDGVDIEYVKEVFTPLNTARVYVSRMQTDQIKSKGGNPVYICNSTGDTKLEEVDPDDVDDDDPIAQLPNDLEAKRKMVHDHFITEEDTITLQNTVDHISETNDNGYEAAFGADVKRFRGQVVDVYSNDDGFGIMTLVDDSVGDYEETPEDLIGDQQRTPGLQVIMNPTLLKYGENSLLDVYGYIEEYDGQVRMQGFGIVPIVEFEREDSSSSSSEHEEETI